jgi:hypothetical protein
MRTVASYLLSDHNQGSVFEVFNENSQLGTIPNIAIAALGFPLTFILFYASIRKAIAETEEDDKRFLDTK